MSTLPRLSGAPNADNTFAVLAGAYYAPAYAGTIALKIRPTSAKTIIQPASLTGAVTFTANVGDDTADDTPPYVGDEIIFMLTAASTEVATFGTGFSATGTLSVTGGKNATIVFIFNGAVWVEKSRAVTA